MINEKLINDLYDIKNWECNGSAKMHDTIVRAIEVVTSYERAYKEGYNQAIIDCENELARKDCVSRTGALAAFKPRGISDEMWENCIVYKTIAGLPPVKGLLVPREETTNDKQRSEGSK